MDLISIIVPVYKVEPYLDRCVRSIVEQTYSNLEIILVDDGSPDNCGAMCDAWAEKDSRIKVIHKENGGLSDARNAGMAIASGTYMGFVDSDGYIAPEMYQLLYERMTQDGSDISTCGVEMVYEDGTPSQPLTRSGRYVLDCASAMEAIISESLLKQPVWYKLYKTELVRNIPFPVGKYHEDVFWSYQAIGQAKKVSVFDTPCYYYTQRSGSIMGEAYSLKRLDALEAKMARVEYMQKNFPQLLNITKQNLWFSCMYSVQMLTKYCTPEVRDEGEKIVCKVLQKYPIQLSCARGMHIKQLIWLVMARGSFAMTCNIRTKLGIGF